MFVLMSGIAGGTAPEVLCRKVPVRVTGDMGPGSCAAAVEEEVEVSRGAGMDVGSGIVDRWVGRSSCGSKFEVCLLRRKVGQRRRLHYTISVSELLAPGCSGSISSLLSGSLDPMILNRAANTTSTAKTTRNLVPHALIQRRSYLLIEVSRKAEAEVTRLTAAC
jgi:hypothetical protein